MILKIYETLWTMLLGFETPLDSGERLPISSYGLSVAWGFEILFFLTTILQIPIYNKGVFSRDTFHNLTNFNLYYVSLKFEFILKGSLQKTLSTIPKNLYWRCLLKRHLPQFHKIQYILKVSLEETLPTISHILIYIDFIFKVSLEETLSTILQILIYTTCLLNLVLYWSCLFKRHLLQFPKNWIYIKGVSSRDTFHNSTKSIIY